jgi:uncharacterized protein DUF4440
MKVCPNCERKYSDSLEYCLADGTVLNLLDDPNATLRIEARPTQTGAAAKRGFPFWVFALAAILGVGVVGVAGSVVLFLARDKPAVDLVQSDNTSNNQGPADEDPRSAMEKEIKNLEQVNSDLCVSMVQSDVAALDRVLADDYSYSNDAGPAWRLNKEQTLTAYRMGRIRYESVTAPDPKVEVNKDLNKAVVSGRAYTVGRLGTTRFNNSYLYQNNYEKRQDRWQLVKAQAWYR